MASTALAPIEPGGYLALSTDLSDVREIIAENLAGQDFGEFDLTRISVPSGKATKYRWEVPTLDGSEAVDEITGIIVLQKRTRQFWPQSIDEGGGSQPPACSSRDGLTGTGKQWATPTDPDPDGEPATLVCSECPNDTWGSGPNGRGKACKQSTSLFVLIGDGQPGSGLLPAVISAPPKSLAPLKKYMGALINANIPHWKVVTAFALEKDTNVGGVEHAVIKPRRVGTLAPNTIELVREYRKTIEPVFDAAATTTDAG